MRSRWKDECRPKSLTLWWKLYANFLRNFQPAATSCLVNSLRAAASPTSCCWCQRRPCSTSVTLSSLFSHLTPFSSLSFFLFIYFSIFGCRRLASSLGLKHLLNFTTDPNRVFFLAGMWIPPARSTCVCVYVCGVCMCVCYQNRNNA